MPTKRMSLFSLRSSNDFGSISEEVQGLPIVWSPPVYSTSDIVYIRKREPKSVVNLRYALMGSMGDDHSKWEEFFQRRFCFNSRRNSMSKERKWLQTNQKEKGTSMTLMRRRCWRRRPPDVRWRSSEEIGGHLFKKRRKKDF